MITAFLLLLTSAPRWASAPVGQATEERPNVIVVVADDLGIGDVSCYGGSIPTPHLDALAAQGVRFAQAYVSAPACAPSRAGYLTGRNQVGFGVEFNIGKGTIAAHRSQMVPREVPMLSEWLHGAGYATGMVGKWHLGSAKDAHPLARGFDEFLGFLDGAHPYLPNTPRGQNGPLQKGRQRVDFEGYLTDALADEAVAFIERQGETPYFLHASFNAPHRPHEAKPEDLARFPDLEGDARVYAAMVHSLDRALGRIVAAVEASGEAQRTVIVFFSDNGAVAGDGQGSNLDLALGKFFMTEGGLRVPLVVHDPRRSSRGRVVQEAVSTLDLVPTLLAACAVDARDARFDGRDLAPWLDGGSDPEPRQLMWRMGPSSALREGELKLVRSAGETWLFRLSDDPRETRDLKRELPGEFERMQAALDRWDAAQPAPSWKGKRLPRQPLLVGRPYVVDF